MGANCCVAAKDKPLPNRISCEVANYRSARHSPSWSFRWDNRTHIEDIMENPSRFSHRNSGNIGSEIKSAANSETERLSDVGSPSDGLQTPKWRKKVGNAGCSKSIAAGQSSRSTSSAEEKGAIKSSCKASASDTNPSLSIPSTPSPSSFKASDPSSSKSRSLHWASSSSRKSRRSPSYQFSRQVSDSYDSSARESHRSSCDGWSMRAFAELVEASSQREQWSLDSENPQNCRLCSKFLKEKSPYSAQKIISTNELAVAAVLVCGHVYHAECLESVTSETDRYDPPCPLCTNGEKMMQKLMGKPQLKARCKISKRAVADIDVDGDSVPCEKSMSVGASSSSKGYFGKKAFLKRHFSLGSRSVSESESTRKKKGFWARRGRD